MKDWNVKVAKITDELLLHIANEFTSGKESKQSLKSAYRFGHSTIRTQIFLVRLYDIPQYVSYHFRTHFSLNPMPPEEYGWMKSKRVDKGGGDFREVCKKMSEYAMTAYNAVLQGDKDTAQHETLCLSDDLDELPDKYERYAPTNFAFTISAEGLMNMAQKRLCIGAVSKETREVMEDICEAVKDVDPDLYPHLVRPCVATGICRERCCGFMRTESFKEARTQYKALFI